MRRLSDAGPRIRGFCGFIIDISGLCSFVAQGLTKSVLYFKGLGLISGQGMQDFHKWLVMAAMRYKIIPTNKKPKMNLRQMAKL